MDKKQLDLALQKNEIEQLDTLREIDRLHKYIGQLYVDRKHKEVSAHIPHLSRRWDILNRLLLQRDKLINDYNAPNAGKAAKPAPFDYTRSGYDYN